MLRGTFESNRCANANYFAIGCFAAGDVVIAY
jgi:hypothetical protein